MATMHPLLLLLLAAALPGRLLAQQPALPEAPPDTTATACSAPEFRQFDFWIGRWSVAAPDREPAAVNEITAQTQGCFLREQFHNASGYTGTSTNWYDTADGRWRQLWIDNSGLILRLEGALEAPGRMVLSGDRHLPDGSALRDRITWTAEPDGSVRQVWDVSRDGGGSWENTFTGLYRRLR